MLVFKVDGIWFIHHIRKRIDLFIFVIIVYFGCELTSANCFGIFICGMHTWMGGDS